MNSTESTGVYGGLDCARQWITMECESLWEMTNGPEGKLVWIRAEIFWAPPCTFLEYRFMKIPSWELGAKPVVCIGSRDAQVPLYRLARVWEIGCKTRDAVAVVGSRACEREGIGVLHVCACSSHESYGSQSFLMILKIRWLPIYVWLRLLIGVLKVLCLLMNLEAY